MGDAGGKRRVACCGRTIPTIVVHKRKMYLRFVQYGKVAGMHSRQGFFDAAYDLRDAPSVEIFTSRKVEEILDWFAANLDRPDRFNRSTSKGYYRKKSRGLSWYKPTAERHIEKSFELAGILREHGIYTDLIKTARPGYVVYEDDFQIVAEPFSDSGI